MEKKKVVDIRDFKCFLTTSNVVLENVQRGLVDTGRWTSYFAFTDLSGYLGEQVKDLKGRGAIFDSEASAYKAAYDAADNYLKDLGL